MPLEFREPRALWGRANHPYFAIAARALKRTQTFCDVQPHLIMSKPTDEQRAALQMLATSHLGCSLTTGMARGFAYEMLQDLMRAGWASVQRDAVGAGKTKVPHLRITAAGRKAIAE
jgi:hypothetical protein